MLLSVEDTALVCGNHIFDVDKGILSSSLLQQLKRLPNEVS